MADTTIWIKRVAAWRASGQTAAEYCERQGLVLSALRYWAQRARREQEATAAVAVPVRLARVERARPSAELVPVVIEVGGARISVARGFDRATLATVLEVLGARVDR
jgi:transposase